MPDLTDLVLSDPDGAPVRIGDVVDRVTVIDLVRYFGCAPCRAFLAVLTERGSELESMGAGALGIGPAAPHQARNLRRTVGFPLLLDPHHLIAGAIGMRRQSLLSFLFDVRGWWRWLRALGSARQGLITGGWWELPAVVVVDARGRVAWVHRGRFIGDYPPVESVLDAVRGVPEA